MATDADLIHRLGGPAMVAHHLKLNVKSVQNWCRPDRGIPGYYWPAICQLCIGQRITLAELAMVQRNPILRWSHTRRVDGQDAGGDAAMT